MASEFTMVTARSNPLNWEVKKRDTLNILVYSHIFQYPLSEKEIFERGKIEADELVVCLSELVRERKIFLIDNFYCLRNDKTIIERRKNRNNRALKYMKIARIVTRIIINFPYIRAVFLSGSISKDCVDPDSDIDFFIITEPKRLWIVNFFCSCFRRFFLLNQSKFFCYNYLIDSKHLSIDERSLYTAIELKTLVPLFGYKYYKEMALENSWAADFFPRFSLLPDKDVTKKQSFIQKVLEKCFNNDLGEKMDKWLLDYSIKKRKRKFNPILFEQPNYYIDLQRHVAKSHILAKYPKIMNSYTQGISEIA
ncbi:nucleotidyltransferase domain-containing protein [Spirosoma foliorum]|uniref:Nucleotidyltransferase domain-containing protein n=1 Tax=Spirosoma foliorum TaxID=2710596 RepID=A0A7G5H629_9BACT|nr:nucleotidyltransferase domain-containing protein [Spirosoma foliorum]QMW06571.1 nucleotidyltransferase domain-containing protein [Spirosoma foliorum]